MKITEITARNSYAVHLAGAPTNEASFEIKAQLQDGDDVDACTKELQERVEAGLAQHAQKIRDIYEVNRKLAEDKKREEQAQAEARRQESMRHGSDLAEYMKRIKPDLITARAEYEQIYNDSMKATAARWPKDVKYLNAVTGDPLSPAEIDRLERFDKDVLKKL